jgi:hypothetical protein
MPSYIEEDVQNAIAAYNRGDHASISRTAAVFSIPPSTLKDRLRKVKSRNQSHEKQQLLSSNVVVPPLGWDHDWADISTSCFGT